MTPEQIEQAAESAAQNKGLVIGSMTAEVYQEGYKDGMRYVLPHQWIPVEERLPEDDSLVLAHFADIDPLLCYAAAYYQDGEWQTPDDFYYDCKIDYWMPIPTIPQNNPEKEER